MNRPPTNEISSEEREKRRAAAKTSLREGWRRAEALGLDRITDEEIDREIAEVRAELARRESATR